MKARVMSLPIEPVRLKCQAPACFCMSSREVLWQILACGLLFATNLAGSDDRTAAVSKGEPTDNLAIADELKEAFNIGFQVGPRSAQEAQNRLARVRRLAPSDPRIDYSHG